MPWSAVPFDAAEARMLPVAELRGRLAAVEPIDNGVLFWTGEPGTELTLGKGWYEAADTEPTTAWLTLADGQVFQLTRQAAKQIGSTARANRKYQEFLPPAMLARNVTWALTEGLHAANGDGLQLKLLVAGTGRNADDTADVPLAVAQTRATVAPFSNVRLLDIITLGIRAKFGHAAADAAVADYKWHHDLEHTSFRVIVPLVQQVIEGTGQEDDAWCYGIEVSNSLIGAKQLIVSGYVFRLADTTGITDVENSAGGFQRRGSTPEMAYDWAATAVDMVLDGPDSAFAGLQALVPHEVDGDYGTVMASLFKESPVAKELQLQVLAALEASLTELTMYDLARLSAAPANFDGASWRDIRSLHNLAGHIVHQGGGMCDGSLPRGCRRLLPEGWEAAASS